MKLCAITKLSAAQGLILVLAACDRSGSTNNIDPVPSNALQPGDAHLVDPHRYLRPSELASAIRRSGHACEVVRAYKQIEQNGKGSAVYKIDCLEYSYRLTINNGQSRIERLTANVVRG